MKYTPLDYAEILYKIKDIDAFMELLKKHWVLAWLPKILKQFEDLYKKKEHIATVTIRSAYPLLREIEESIKNIVRQEERDKIVQFVFIIDNSLIGGFRAESDEIIIPASIIDRIERLNLKFLTYFL